MKQTPELKSYCDNINLNEFFYTQNFGVLLIIDHQDLIIKAVSENIDQWIDLSPDQLIGQCIEDYFSHEGLALCQQVSQKQQVLPQSKVIELSANGCAKQVVLSVAYNEGHLTCDIEPMVDDDEFDGICFIARCMQSFSEAHAEQTIFELALSAIYEISGFDSVMLYKYYDETYGQVVAQKNQQHMPDFKDHYFPESDTPKAIKELFRQGLYRYIPNVNYQRQSIITEDNCSIYSLKYSSLRGVVPVHIDFLKNMNAQAALSLPIIQQGRLWGIVACQHASPLYLSPKKRQLLVIISQMLTNFHAKFLVDHENKIRQNILSLLDNVADKANQHQHHDSDQQSDFSSIVKQWLPPLCEYVNCDGLVYCIEQTCYTQGDYLSIDAVKQLFNTLMKQNHNRLVYINYETLQQVLKGHQLNEVKSAVMLILNQHTQAFALFYRLGEVRRSKWAGNPNKAVNIDSTNDSVSPRQSFMTWTQEHQHAVKPWREIEKVALEQIHRGLAEKCYHQMLSEHAFVDQLTGLYNRHYMIDSFKNQSAVAKRQKQPYSLILIDIDHFKPINDKYGHTEGDKALVTIAQAIDSHFRYEDVTCRYGGEEFVVLMLDVPLAMAVKRSNDFRQRIEQMDFYLNDEKVDLTVSIGVACANLYENDLSVTDMIEIADKHLYKAKQHGRNQVVSSCSM